MFTPVEWMAERNGRKINQSSKAPLQRHLAEPGSWGPAGRQCTKSHGRGTDRWREVWLGIVSSFPGELFLYQQTELPDKHSFLPHTFGSRGSIHFHSASLHSTAMRHMYLCSVPHPGHPPCPP